jgi:PTS system nitrogen regulatory IIA component
MKLDAILTKEAVFAELQARDRKQALKQLAASVSELCGIGEREIYSTLIEREGRGSTCMGSGVCIPHGRFEGLAKPYAFFAKLETPIEYDSPDGKPVDLMFLLLTPLDANTEHLKSLALISKLLRNKLLCENLRRTHDAETLYHLMYAASREDAA